MHKPILKYSFGGAALLLPSHHTLIRLHDRLFLAVLMIMKIFLPCAQHTAWYTLTIGSFFLDSHSRSRIYKSSCRRSSNHRDTRSGRELWMWAEVETLQRCWGEFACQWTKPVGVHRNREVPKAFGRTEESKLF